jgi:hypothetical protein
MHIHGRRHFSLILAMYKGGEVVERDQLMPHKPSPLLAWIGNHRMDPQDH